MRTLAVAALTPPPFPELVSGHVDAVGHQSQRWAAELGLVSTPDALRRLDRANAAELAGRTCPDARPEQLRLLTDLFTWLFAFDDSCDDDELGQDPGRLAPIVGGLLDVLDVLGGPAPSGLATVAGPAGAALHDLCRRVRAHDTPHLLLRFANQMRDYLLALLWEAANRERSRVPAVAEYLQMRRHTGGVRPSLTLTDLVYGGGDAAHRADPRASTLDNLATDLVCWCNDIFSYEKERRQGGDGHNLVAVLARAADAPERSGLVDAAARFNAALGTYLRVESELLIDADAETIRFVTARRCWIRGSYDWSLRASRYQ
ncbi:terpene synthase family protein [Plantactinospora sonchi]|uniref:Terpene synthase n=1 Tax=Plantactinospora sonchi TaxID=1544735 RepID=A0ABU7RW29_9ACTN